MSPYLFGMSGKIIMRLTLAAAMLVAAAAWHLPPAGAAERGKSRTPHVLTEAELAPIRIEPALEELFEPPPGQLDPPRGLLDPRRGPLHAPRLKAVPKLKPLYPLPGLTVFE